MNVSKLTIKRLSQVMGQFATGLTVVTTQVENQVYAQRIHSFTAVSMEPALVLFCLPKTSSNIENLKQSKRFAINVLPIKLREKVSMHASVEERFGESLDLEANTQSPILQNTLAWLDCKLYTVQDGGDHYIFIGKVLDLQYQFENSPLLHFRGKFQNILEV